MHKLLVVRGHQNGIQREAGAALTEYGNCTQGGEDFATARHYEELLKAKLCNPGPELLDEMLSSDVNSSNFSRLET